MAQLADDIDLPQPALTRLARPLSLIPVGLKEAALDSPTFRATALHFAAQFEAIEAWLKDYVKQATRLADRFSALNQEFDGFKKFPLPPPPETSQAVLDHDYTLLATTRHCDGAREYLQTIFRNMEKSRSTVVNPLNAFVKEELRLFRDSKDSLKRAQRDFDNELAKYASQAKTKEPSSLREDAFKLHEVRKQYLKSCMDFCIQAPNFRANLDKLLVKVCSDQWKDFRSSREATATTFAKWGSEMERIRGWSKEMDDSEPVFKRELLMARRQIEDSAEQLVRPSRELEDYAASTVPFLASSASTPFAPPKPGQPDMQMPEKQGWLFLKTSPPKPARTTWSRRWFFVKNGIFGWLLHGYASGGVEESDKIGVLLCSLRPALQEERRFCFEVKTKDTTIVLQAETQTELLQWICAFDMAKRKALEDPSSSETSRLAPGSDPAFAVTSPISPEFAAKVADSQMAQTTDDPSALPTSDPEKLASRTSFDVTASRRSTMLDGESSRDHAARIMQKLDLHRKASPAPQLNPAPSGGIASLINASHNVLPVGPASPRQNEHQRSFTMPVSSFAPSTLASPPASTNLSERAIAISSERGLDFGGTVDGSGTPSGIMANLWGSTNWSYTNRRTREMLSPISSPVLRPKTPVDDMGIMDGMNEPPKDFRPVVSGAGVSPSRISHRKTISVVDTLDTLGPRGRPTIDNIINDYPLTLKTDDALSLKAHDAQFRVLFTDVPRSEKVVLVFTAMWNPNEQQEFPGRVYVTTESIYFYSNHFGMVLVTEISLASIEEVTAAPGRENECDFLFLHFKESLGHTQARRVTIKTFLASLSLLQRRLDYLVRNANSENPASLEEVFKVFTKMGSEKPRSSPSMQSWEELGYSQGEEADVRTTKNRSQDLKTSLRIDGRLYGEQAGRTGREVTKFKLPSQAVKYKPQGMGDAAVVRSFNISAKALFHVIFGDRSAVFQILCRHRAVQSIAQTPWTQPPGGRYTRQFIRTLNDIKETDIQSLDVNNDHLCYVVTQTLSPSHLPFAGSFHLLNKFVITHSAKSKCELAIYNQVVWRGDNTPVGKPSVSQRLVQKQALRESEADAVDLTNIVADQVSRLGPHSKTNKALQVYGALGQSTQTTHISPSELPKESFTRTRKTIQQHTLTDLYTEAALTEAFRLFTLVIDLGIALAKSAAGIVTAHSLLVVLLATSMVYNSWHSYRDGMVWYHERNAGKFMAKLGVRSDPTMARAVYLSDIDDLISIPTAAASNGSAPAPDVMLDDMQDWNTCRGTFSDIVMSPDPKTSMSTLPSTQKGASRRTTARLQRSRHSLARHRHDLLVGLRVVNRVEEEVVQAEWEDWVAEEDEKCRRVHVMLSEQKKRGGKQEDKTVEDQGLGDDFTKYCDSCREEAVAITRR